MRLKEVRIEKDLQQKEMAAAIGIDIPMLSRFENYKCLPTIPTMYDILKVLDCEINDIYDDSEIYIKKSKGEKQEQIFYKLTVNLPLDAKSFLKMAIKKCGYHNISHWIWRCYERLQNQYEIKINAENAKKGEGNE